MNDNVRVLAWAYACEPDRGSEPGAGWMWALMLADLGEAWVVTRSNNREAIEAALPAVPERDRLHFIYVDLPAGVRRWKRGRRGIHVYYLAWQFAALRTSRRVLREQQIDLVWHLTLANAWFGSLAGHVGPPFIYGPVGGAARPPVRLRPVLGLRGAAYEALRDIVQAFARLLNPLARSAWRRAELMLVQNEETRRWVPKRYRGRVVVFPNVVLGEPMPQSERQTRRPMRTALFVGELRPLKGISLALRALSFLPDWKLLVIGDGPDGPRLHRLARRWQIDERVEFRGGVSRSAVLEAMSGEADVFLFPSLRDQAGWVVPEALACGLPVVCVASGGPVSLGGSAVTLAGPARTARLLAEAVVSASTPITPSAAFSRETRQRALIGVLREHRVLGGKDGQLYVLPPDAGPTSG